MFQLQINVPTYYGSCPSSHAAGRKLPEFGAPEVPVLIQPVEGVRVVLGSHDRDTEAPDIQIERRPNGWAVFLHPLAGSDASGYVYFLDDGRSFLLKENDVGTTPPLKLVGALEDVPHLDDPPARERSGRKVI